MSGKQQALKSRPADLDALYRAHVRAVFGFIYSRVGNREAAEDLTSEVFVRALAHLDPTREERSIVAWLFRVARNAINDYWREGHSAQVIALDNVRLARGIAAPPDLARQEQTARRATALLQQLPENYRTVLTHRLIEGLSVAETARQMGTTEGNVKVLQYRALKRAAELRESEDANER